MDYFKVITVLVLSATLSQAEPPVNTYLPAARLSSTALRTQYGAPASNNALSTRYGAPRSSQYNQISAQYRGAPLNSQLIGAGGLQGRLSSTPSAQYGAPSSASIGLAGQRYTVGSFPSFLPSSRYGVPTNAVNTGGYSGSTTAGGYQNAGGYAQEDDQSEPANYQFQYDVLAPEYGVEFGHAEARQGDDTRGTYYVLLPDGRRQRVDYTADLDGYKPVITYEDTTASRFGNNGGYQNGGAGGYQNGGAGGYQNRGASGYQNGGAGGYQNGGAGGYQNGGAGGYQNGGAGGYQNGGASGYQNGGASNGYQY